MTNFLSALVCANIIAVESVEELAHRAHCADVGCGPSMSLKANSVEVAVFATTNGAPDSASAPALSGKLKGSI